MLRFHDAHDGSEFLIDRTPYRVRRKAFRLQGAGSHDGSELTLAVPGGEDDTVIFYVRETLEEVESIVERWRDKERMRDASVRDQAPAAENGRLRDLVSRAVQFTANWTAGHPRWSAVRDTFSVGSTTAKSLCREFDMDPDEVKP